MTKKARQKEDAAALQEAAQRANSRGSKNPGTWDKGHATAVVIPAKFLLFYVRLQAADPITERASLCYEVNLPRTCIVQPRPGASAADRA